MTDKIDEIRKDMAYAEMHGLYQSQDKMRNDIQFLIQALDKKEAQIGKCKEILKVASEINDVSRYDFETLRVIKFDKFNIHELDTLAVDARQTLAELETE